MPRKAQAPQAPDPTTGFYSIIDYAVDGPASQSQLIDAFTDLQERWVRFYPGYCSARLFGSVDGTRVYNVVHWASETDYRNFEAASDTEGRLSAIEAAIAGISGRAEPMMTGAPWFRIAHEVAPAPEPSPGSHSVPAGDET